MARVGAQQGVALVGDERDFARQFPVCVPRNPGTRDASQWRGVPITVREARTLGRGFEAAVGRVARHLVVPSVSVERQVPLAERRLFFRRERGDQALQVFELAHEPIIRRSQRDASHCSNAHRWLP
jgi:hypothetical protein